MLKKIVTNFTALFTGETIARLCHFVAVIYIARKFGASGFGAVNFALAIISYFLILVNLGLAELGIREVARKRDVEDMAGTILSIRLFLAVISFLAIILIASFSNRPPNTAGLIIIYGVTIFPYALSFEWVFTGIEEMKYNAYGRVMSAILYLALIFILVRGPGDILKVAVVNVTADIVAWFYYYSMYKKRFKAPALHFDIAKWKALIPVSVQLSAAAALMIVYMNFGTIALGFIMSEKDVGIYGAASRLAFFFFALSTVIVTAVFPAISRMYHESSDKLEKLLSYTVKITLALGFPLGVSITILGPKIINLFYGSAYAEAGPLLQIMGWFAAINLTGYTLSYALVPCDRQNIYFKILLAGTVFNILVNFIGIPFIGYYASSVAIVLTEFLIMILAFNAMNRVARIPILSLSTRPVIASVLMGVFLVVAFKWNIFLLMASGAAVYFVVLLAIGGFKKAEILKIKEAFA